jgi:hypothetical protein
MRHSFCALSICDAAMRREDLMPTPHSEGHHALYKCECGTLLWQCRCFGPKRVIVIPIGCGPCRVKEKAHDDCEAPVPSRLTLR